MCPDEAGIGIQPSCVQRGSSVSGAWVTHANFTANGPIKPVVDAWTAPTEERVPSCRGRVRLRKVGEAYIPSEVSHKSETSEAATSLWGRNRTNGDHRLTALQAA